MNINMYYRLGHIAIYLYITYFLCVHRYSLYQTLCLSDGLAAELPTPS